jgi:SAM-dependent methyltransferase
MARTDLRPTATLDPAYDQLAAAYDLITAEYRHERWLDAIEALARGHGLSGRRVLDVACGTGKSFLPLLARGYRVTACDISPRMAALARAKAAGRAEVHVADMRHLPVFGEFDLVTCLDDALNHLVSDEDLLATLAGMCRNLRPRGIAVFDVNTLAAYRNSGDWVTEDDRRLVVWRGDGITVSEPGDDAEVVIELFTRADGDRWRRTTTRQRHRHFPIERVRSLAEAAGLRVLAAHGQRPGVVLEQSVDERRDHKAVLVTRRCDN